MSMRVGAVATIPITKAIEAATIVAGCEIDII
jgi:hypothetical protein